MIVSELPTGRSPRVVAVYSFRYDAHLVPALLENLAPLVDGWIGFDDRRASELFSPEVARRNLLLETARESGAEWVVCLDPDERLDRRLAERMPELTAVPGRKYSFWYRNLYQPDAYRVDGAWGRRRRAALFSLAAGLVDPGVEQLHLPWDAHFGELDEERLDLAMYHLKMLAPERRLARAALYEHIDPEHRMQSVGYDYLTDERWLQLERIVPGEGFLPEHQEDGGLWAGEIPTGALARSQALAAERDPTGVRVTVVTGRAAEDDKAGRRAVEAARSFVGRGDSVLMAAWSFDEQLRSELDGIETTSALSKLRFDETDLVWVEAGMVDVLVREIGRAAQRRSLPLIVIADDTADPALLRGIRAVRAPEPSDDGALTALRRRARRGAGRRGLLLWASFRRPRFRRAIAAAEQRNAGGRD